MFDKASTLVFRLSAPNHDGNQGSLSSYLMKRTRNLLCRSRLFIGVRSGPEGIRELGLFPNTGRLKNALRRRGLYRKVRACAGHSLGIKTSSFIWPFGRVLSVSVSELWRGSNITIYAKIPQVFTFASKSVRSPLFEIPKITRTSYTRTASLMQRIYIIRVC